MKNKFKLNDIYVKKLEEAGIDLSELNSGVNYVVKRLSLESSIDLPDENGYVVGNVSTIDIDSDGDVVLPEGIDFKRYEKNPIVLWNHSLSSPIGYTESISVNPTGVVSKIKFSTVKEAQDKYTLAKDKVLRCFSIGFIPLEVLIKGTPAFNEMVKTLSQKFPDKFNINTVTNLDRIVTKSLLIETSLVSVPANEDALVEIVKNLKAENVDEPEVVKESEVIGEVKSIDKPIEIKRVGKEITIKRIGTVDEERNKALYKALWGI